MKILSMVGARPNFIKMAPILREFQHYPALESRLVHSGQHIDEAMSAVFFDQLELPKPDYDLGVQGGTQIQQLARMMLAFEEVVVKEKPGLVLVVGDVTSTLAGALVAVKTGIPVAHVEAGLRSGDRNMPEEINRILTDSMADLLFVTEQSGLDNLRMEGIPAQKIHFVGNCMIDSLLFYQEKSARTLILEALGLRPKKYILMTLHRPSNVDSKEGLQTLLRLLELLVPLATVVFPVHPRTRANIMTMGMEKELATIQNLHVLEPQGYLEFQQLLTNAAVVLTDSGGIQEETTYLQVPCLTFRETTERPVTVQIGTNELIFNLNPDLAREKVMAILNGAGKHGKIPVLWDGKAAQRIAAVINSYLR